jgi:hypothetical protein
MPTSETASCFQLGVRFPDGTLQTTAATTAAPTPPGGTNGQIQFNNGGAFGGLSLVPLANGGTNANLSATGGASFVLRQSSIGAAITVSQLSASDLSNGIVGTGAVVLASDILIAPTAVGSAGFWAGLGNIFAPAGSILQGNAGNISALNVVRALMFYLPTQQVVGNISIHITAGTTGGVVDVGIYSLAGNKLVNAGGLAATAAANVTSTVAQVTLAPGYYYFAHTGFQSGGTLSAIAYDCLNIGMQLTGLTTPLVNIKGVRWGTAANAGVAGVLPATLGVITANNQTFYPPAAFMEP